MATLANQNNKDETKTPTLGGAVTQPGAGSPAFIGNAAQAQNKPASSGRFVNTQAYMNANKGAGQQIGGAIQGGINRQLEQEKTATNKEADNVRAGIQSAQGNVQQGGQLLGKVGGDATAYGNAAPVQRLNEDQMLEMANDANQLKQFTDYRTGNIAAQDTTNLTNLNTGYVNRAAAANAALQSRQQQLSNEANRFGLLQEFVGQKNNYGQGAQRLDQTFLQKDKSNALGNLNQNLAQRKAGDFAQLTNAATGLKDTSGQVIEQGSALAQALQDQTNKNETGYINELGQYVDVVNQDRQKQQKAWEDSLGILKGSQQGTVDTDFWNKTGMRDNMNVYNTFDNINDLSEIATKGRMAQGYQDVATQKDVDRYGGLAKLAGISNDKLRQAGNLDAAVAARMTADGKNTALLDRINQSVDTFKQNAKDRNFGGVYNYEDAWGDDYTTQYADRVNMGDLLGINAAKPDDGKVYFTGNNPGPVGDLVQGGAGAVQTGIDDVKKDLTNVFTGKGDTSDMLNLGTFGMANVATDLMRGISGNSNRASREAGALQNAYNVRNNNMQNWLNNQGTYKAATRSGVQDTRNMVSTGPAITEGSSGPMSFDQVRELLKTRGK